MEVVEVEEVTESAPGNPVEGLPGLGHKGQGQIMLSNMADVAFIIIYFRHI